MKSTQFFFEIRNSAFLEGVNIFSGFFHSPLLDPLSIQMEINNVDSEFSKNITNESWREVNILRLNSNPGSVYHQFSTGNKKTLDKPGIYEEMRDFYKKNYRYLGKVFFNLKC
jgi:insulysin